MSNNTTKPNTSNKKSQKPPKAKGDKFISRSHILLPGNKKIKMGFVRWVMLITLIGLLILVLVTYPNRAIKNDIKALTSKDEIVAYCAEENLNCTFTVLSDYDIEGYQVARVMFLQDEFFGTTETTEDSTESSADKSSDKPQRNVYITVQKGQAVELPE